MATKTLRVFAEYTSTGFVPMPTAGNIDYGFTLGSTFPATTPATYQTDNPDLVVTVTAMTDFYVWIRVNGTAWNPSYTRNVRVYPDSPNINNVVMNMIIATGPAGVSSYTQIVQTSNRLYFNGATTDSVYNSKFAGKTYINELNFGTAPGLATVATSGAYADLTGKPTLATVATSGLFTDLSSKPSGTAPLSYNSGTNSFVITQANTSTNGFLSSTDWNTFNNKLATPSGTTLQYVDGTGALQTFPVLASADKLVINVRNSSGVSMPKGSVVYINGATGNKPTVALAQANSDASSAQTLGLLQATLANNAEGNVVIVGAVADLNTSAFTEGQQLYLSPTTAGAYTTTKPYAPNHLVYVGVVTRSHVSLGVIEVKVQNGYEMDELHNVSAQSPSNNDGLFYNTTTSLWEKKSIATVLGYTPYNGTDTSIKALFSASAPLSYSNGVYGISQATTSSNGYLSSTDWNTFNNKGAGTVTSVAMTMPLGLSVSGSPITTSGTFGITLTAGYVIPSTTSTSEWGIAYNNRITSLTVTGSSGSATLASNVLNIPTYTLVGLGGQAALNGTGFVKISGTTISYDNSIYLTTTSASSTYQTIITNPVTGTGTTNYIPKFTSSTAIGNSNLINDANGNLGLGVTPSAWNTSFGIKVIDIANGCLMSATNDINIIYNHFINSAGGDIYKVNGFASKYTQASGEHRFFTASSGTAGNAITFTQAMTLNASGNLGLGIADATGVANRILHINGADSAELHLTRSNSGSSSTFGGYVNFDGSNNFNLQNRTGNAINLIVGTTTRLAIATTGKATFSADVLAISDINSNYGFGAFRNGSNTQGSGPYYLLSNAESNQLWYQQLNASNGLDYWYNGSIKMAITSTGFVGIGVTAPTAPLTIQATSGGVTIRMVGRSPGNQDSEIAFIANNNSTVQAYLTASNAGMDIMTIVNQPMRFHTNNAERMRITSAGNVGIGSTFVISPYLTSPQTSGVLQVATNISKSATANTFPIAFFGSNDSTYPLGLYIGMITGSTSGARMVKIQGTEIGVSANHIVMQDDGGNLLLGTSTNNGEKLYVNGAIRATGNITANSDLILKKNLKIIENPIDKLMQLNGYSYQWKENDEYQYGVVAQEVEKVLPYAVQTGNNKIKGVAYNQLTPLLIEGFKSHESEITILKARVKYLESKIA